MQSMQGNSARPLRVGGLALSSNVLMAPLAGYTCYPFRMLAYELGAGLCFTEMCSAAPRRQSGGDGAHGRERIFAGL